MKLFRLHWGITIFALYIFNTTPAAAQFHEMGLELGSSHMLGDLGGGNREGQMFALDADLSLTRYSGGLFYRLHILPRINARLFANYLFLKSSDEQSGNVSRFNRGMTAETQMYSSALMVEVYPWPINLCSALQFRPYLAGGAGLIRYNVSSSFRVFDAETFEGNAEQVLEDRSFAVEPSTGLHLQYPIALGFRWLGNSRITLGLEASYTFTTRDDLDAYDRMAADHFAQVKLAIGYRFCGSLGGGMACPSFNMP